jgi:hypothetical protein
MQKAELLKHGFVERNYPDQAGVFYVKEGKVGHFPYAREHIGDMGDIGQYDDALMAVTPDNKVQFMIGVADYVEVYPLDTEEGQALLKDGIAAKVSQHFI